MCGIVGYSGKREAIPLIVSGLKKLEYRGYDSAGVATVLNNSLNIFRAEGKLKNLEQVLEKNYQARPEASQQVGIGHTRWATHGRPNETNAHPHRVGKVCLVHNGIIENYLELRKELLEASVSVSSDTDSEIIAHLVSAELVRGLDLFSALKKAACELRGSYAILAISADEPETLVVARSSSPVVIGLLESEVFVASDIPAALEYTRDFIILEDGEFAKITGSTIYLEKDGKEIKREPIHVTWDPISAEKGGYPHFMLKEIYEQPQVVTDTFRGRLDFSDYAVALDDIKLSPESIASLDRVVIVGCGSAWHAGLVTKFYIEKFAKLPVSVDYASEFRYRESLVNEKTLFIAISQSGETADTLGALEVAKKGGAKTLAITNVIGSSLTRSAENLLYTRAGPEISVASTKAFATQLVAGYLLGLYLGKIRGVLDDSLLTRYSEQLLHVPHAIQLALDQNESIEVIAREFSQYRDFLYLARGLLYPIALEGALKLKEISYIHAEGYPAGEMKHGPIALISEEMPVVGILGNDGTNREKTLSNLEEVRTRGGKLILVCDEAPAEFIAQGLPCIEVGKCGAEILPMVLSVPLQLLSYHIAVLRGTDVDQPRNLAKSVTVE